MNTVSKAKPVPHLSFESGEKLVLEEVDGLLLWRISDTGSLAEAARLLGMSYRNAWGRIRRLESSYGRKIVETKVGGASGGGARLTQHGLELLREFRRMSRYLTNAMDDSESAGNVRYQLSARNLVRARVTRIQRGDITSLINMTSSETVKFTSIISNEAVDDLDLKEGDDVHAVIKSTEVMIAKGIPKSLESRSKVKHAKSR